MDNGKPLQSHDEKSHSAQVSMESEILAEGVELDSVIPVK